MESKNIIIRYKKISTIILDEIENNPDFAHKIGEALNILNDSSEIKKSKRRTTAKIDPFILYEQGIETLKNALFNLSIEELKDVIAANGMDNARLAMKWKDRERLEKHIIDKTHQRATRGSAFWSMGAEQNESHNNKE